MADKKTDVDITSIDKTNLNKFLRTGKYNATNFDPTGAYKDTKSTSLTSGTLGVSEINVGNDALKIDAAQRNIRVKEGDITKILIGRRPDGTYGIFVSDEGYDAYSLYSGESLLSTSGNTDYKEFNPANFTYSSATRINVSNYDPARYFQKGDRLVITQTTDKYLYITNVTSTYIDVTGGSSYSVANAAITYFATSRLQRPSGFPASLNFAPNPTAGSGSISSSTILINEFSITGDRVQGYFNIQLQASGVDGITLDLPAKGYDYGSAGAWVVGSVLTVSQLTPAMGYVSMFQTAGMNTVFVPADTNPVGSFENDSAISGFFDYKLA